MGRGAAAGDPGGAEVTEPRGRGPAIATSAVSSRPVILLRRLAPLFAAPLVAQASAAPAFAPPVRLAVAGKWLGAERAYPSPVLHDVDGDGLADLVIGDLKGLVTVAKRERRDGAPSWAAEQPLLATDGRPLDFHNW